MATTGDADAMVVTAPDTAAATHGTRHQRTPLVMLDLQDEARQISLAFAGKQARIAGSIDGIFVGGTSPRRLDTLGWYVVADRHSH